MIEFEILCSFLLIFTVIFAAFFGILIGKLNKIEKLLQKKNTPDKKEISFRSPVSDHAPAPPVTKEEIRKPFPEQHPEKNTKKPSAFRNFLLWLWRGSVKEQEGVSAEYAVATTWLIRAGIFILLCGIGFFLKYSIQNGLVSPPLRICLTFLCGAGMFCGGLYGINKRFHILAAGILSAGIVTLYMGAFAGYKLYALLPAGAAFSFMILTTVSAMLVSVKRNILSSALTACTGGYLTPIILSSGSANLPLFLGYIVIISAGILIVSRERRWRSLEILSFCLSYFLIITGTAGLYYKVNWLCFLFLFLNFLIFSAIPLFRKQEDPVGKTELLLPVFSAVLTLGTGLAMIQKCCEDLVTCENLIAATFTVLISGVTLGEGVWLKNKKENGAKILPAFLCASIFSLALAVPIAIQNSGAIATGWSVLGLVLVLASAKSRNKTLLILSVIIFFAAFITVVSASEEYTDFLFLERFFRGGTFTFALLGAGFLLRKHGTEQTREQQKNTDLFPTFMSFFFIAGGFAFLWFTSFEVYHYLKICTALHHFRHGGLSLWWAILAILLITVGIRKDLRSLRGTGLALFIICLVKIYCVDISGLNTLGKVIAFLLLGLLFLGGAAAYIIFRKRFAKEK